MVLVQFEKMRTLGYKKYYGRASNPKTVTLWKKINGI
jgi:hypothetical protein